jgi:hypothetical protein
VASTPSKFQDDPEDIRVGQNPDGNLTLKHAHGYRSHDTKDTAKYIGDGSKIIFSTANLGVVQCIDKEARPETAPTFKVKSGKDIEWDKKYRQEFFNLHD